MFRGWEAEKLLRIARRRLARQTVSKARSTSSSKCKRKRKKANFCESC